MYKNFKEFLNERDAYLNEARKSQSSGAKYKPKTYRELKALANDDNIHLGDIDISNVNDLSRLFEYSKRKDFSGIEYWDVSHVKNMSWMFDSAYYFKADISRWNVSNVTNMRGMFRGCEGFNQPIGRWDVSNVTDMGYMFASCRMFNKPLYKWDVSNVTDMSYMFMGCWHFNQPLKKWNLRSVKDVRAMFLEAHNFDQNLSSWEEKYNIRPEDIYDRERLEKLGL